MREIKFRAWDKERHKMWTWGKNGWGLWLSEENQLLGCPLSDFLSNPRFEIMQYTGLKDKNGKEIYEGDLLVHDSRNGHRPHPVIFYKDLASWCGDYRLKYPLQISELSEVEIIGNVHENPELLETKDDTASI